jgi:hypothetical protein
MSNVIKIGDLFNEPVFCSTCPGCEKLIKMSHEPFEESVGAMCGQHYVSNALLYWHPECYKKALKELSLQNKETI